MTDATSRLDRRFAELRAQKRPALATFVMAGDPDRATAQAILDGLPEAGADIVELGMPFSDPMADGPAIQAAGVRALKKGMTLAGVLEMARAFRQKNAATPLVLMGYYNPVFSYGVERFLQDAKAAGVDGLIIVDLPPEEDAELRVPAQKLGIDLIRLLAPTTDARRLETVLKDARGFLYYVSITGTTGTKAVAIEPVRKAVAAIRAKTDLPVVVGFGITTPEEARQVGEAADGAVVGSAIVSRVAAGLSPQGAPAPTLTSDVLGFVRSLRG